MGVVEAIFSRNGIYAGALLFGGVALAPMSVSAQEPAGPSLHSMLGKMPSDDWYPFVAGVIEGVAFHRYMAAGKEAGMMDCIYDWFYEDEATLKTIYAALNQYPDYPPASVVDALAKKKCGGE